MSVDHPAHGWSTVAELAARYAVSSATVYRWAARGDIPVVRLPGGTLRIPAGAADRALTRRITRETPEAASRGSGSRGSIETKEAA